MQYAVKIGRDDLAFMLLNRKEYPSWLYPVTQGATTIWEMKEWRVFFTTDLVNWIQRAAISPKDNYMDDNSADCMWNLGRQLIRLRHVFSPQRQEINSKFAWTQQMVRCWPRWTSLPADVLSFMRR